jgi:hypothetical protein
MLMECFGRCNVLRVKGGGVGVMADRSAGGAWWDPSIRERGS